MTKAELVDIVAKKAGVTKAQAGKAVNAVVEGVTGALKKKDKLILPGFGTFCVVRRKARKGKNPKTGQTITIPATNVPKFKAGKALKAAVK